MKVSRSISTFLALAGLALTTSGAVTAPASAAPSGGGCPPGQRPVTEEVRDTATGKIVQVTLCVPVSGGGNGDDDGGGNNDDGGGNEDNDGNYTLCRPWAEAYPNYDPYKPADTPPDAEAYLCVRHIGGNPVLGPYLPTWLTPGQPPPPSPEELAADLLAQVRANLPTPTVDAYPGTALPAKVHIPTFVAVGNWQDAYTTPESCDPTGVVCVELDLAPALTFDPGDGSDAVDCTGGGTVYTVDMGSPRDLVVPGACTHTYTRRTGVDGAPDAYEATATVTWSVAYRQTRGGGAAGTLADIPLTSEPWLRVVDEMQTTVGGDQEG